MNQVTRNPELGERIGAERPPHRLERLGAVMEEQSLDCIVAFGPDEANYVAGYWRYYGGPSGVVVARDGERTLAVMRDEVPVAERLGEADSVLGFGERGFGIDLSPLPLLANAIASVPALASARRVGIADGLGPMRELLRSHLDAELVGIEAELVRSRLRKDEDELVKMAHAYELCWLGQAAVAEAVERRSKRDRGVLRRPVDGADRTRRADRVPGRRALGARHVLRCAARSGSHRRGGSSPATR